VCRAFTSFLKACERFGRKDMANICENGIWIFGFFPWLTLLFTCSGGQDSCASEGVPQGVLLSAQQAGCAAILPCCVRIADFVGVQDKDKYLSVIKKGEERLERNSDIERILRHKVCLLEQSRCWLATDAIRCYLSGGWRQEPAVQAQAAQDVSDLKE
jgi:hypothetical protein